MAKTVTVASTIQRRSNSGTKITKVERLGQEGGWGGGERGEGGKVLTKLATLY